MTKNQKIQIAWKTIDNYVIELQKFADVCNILDGLLEPKEIAIFINGPWKDNSIEDQNMWYADTLPIGIAEWMISE